MEVESASISPDLLIEIRPEELVTFQIVLIGSDGLVVGSDRMQSYVTPDQQRIRSRLAVQRSEAFKFVPENERDNSQIVCAFAGGPYAKDMALQILSKCTPTCSDTDWDLGLRSAADNVPHYRGQRYDEATVVRPDVLDASWVVTKLDNQPASVRKVTDHSCTGDICAARFLPLLLWRRSPVSELKALALLTLAYFAAEVNPASFRGGFDLLTLAKGKRPKWERYEPENASLKTLQKNVR